MIIYDYIYIYMEEHIIYVSIGHNDKNCKGHSFTYMNSVCFHPVMITHHKIYRYKLRIEYNIDRVICFKANC